MNESWAMTAKVSLLPGSPVPIGSMPGFMLEIEYSHMLSVGKGAYAAYLGPMNCTGLQRSEKTGSVRIERPAICTRTLACPSHVTCSAFAACNNILIREVLYRNNGHLVWWRERCAGL